MSRHKYPGKVGRALRAVHCLMAPHLGEGGNYKGVEVTLMSNEVPPARGISDVYDINGRRNSLAPYFPVWASPFPIRPHAGGAPGCGRGERRTRR